MALLDNNLKGPAVILNPAGLIATPYNFMSLYDYATQYQPELIPELFYANGSGDLTGLLEVIGNNGTYQSDKVKWSEMGRLHGVFTASISTNTFTSSTPHNLRVGDEVLVVDTTAKEEGIGVVTVVTDANTFTALNKSDADWSLFTNSVTVSGDFTNSFAKGSETFEEGKKWDPNIKENYTHIIKEVYEVPNSDMLHKTWIDTPEGPMWFNVDLERTRTLFRNKETLTHLFNPRIAASASVQAGHDPGLKSIVQQTEEGGNLINGLITSVSDLEAIALRLVQQNSSVKEVFVFCEMAQMNEFNSLMAALSSGNVGAPHYGAFANGPDMALMLDFRSVWVSGITFHFKHLQLLDDPTVYGFNNAGISYLIVPAGKKEVSMGGQKVMKPYLSVLYRSGNGINRRVQTKIFGEGGTKISKDVTRWEFLTETTNMVVGVNSWFVGRRDGSFYP